MNTQLWAAYEEARRTFLPYAGVLGVGIGPKYKGDELVARDSIVILVERKLARARVPQGQLVPERFGGYPTDVREPVFSSSLDGNQECAGDENWIDWGKIHQLNVQQRSTRPSRPARRKRTAGTADEPPEDIPTTETQGNLFIIHDPSGTLVTTVGTSQTIDVVGAWNLFRASFGDDYDFATFYIDQASGLPGDGNYSTDVFNSVTGIGKGPANSRATWGSTRLLRRSNHVWFSLRTLLHEVGHQWLAFVDYRLTSAGATQDLLHQDFPYGASQAGFHWGRWADDVQSCMDYDRHEWVAAGAGSYNWVSHSSDEFSAAGEQWFDYWSLDQYLMGLIPDSAVGSLNIVQSPTPTVSDASIGPYTPTPSVLTITPANVEFEEGTRSPDYLNSQRVFHQAHILLSKDTSSTSAFITQSQGFIQRHTPNFRRAASGLAMMDTSLLRPNYDDLYVKDNAADTGTGPSSGTFWLSPDLWVRNADDDGTDHQCPIRGQTNWIYIRVRNRGAQQYDNVVANAYLGNFESLTPGTEFLYPNDWNPQGLLGSAAVTVPAASGGTDGAVIAKVAWTSDKIPPAAGWHPCMLGEVIPIGLDPNGLHHVWENKKLAQRNVTIIDPAGGCPPMGDLPGQADAFFFVTKFTVGNAARVARATELRIQAIHPSSRVQLFLDPAGLVDGLAEAGEILEANVPLQAGRAITDEASVQAIAPFEFASRTLGARGFIGALGGSTLMIPAGTEVGLVPGWEEDPDQGAVWIRFRSEARLQVGFREHVPLIERYSLHGLRPVVLNGTPLLRVDDNRDARITFRLGTGSTPTLRLIGLVSSGHRTGTRTRYDITEAAESMVLGGFSVEVGG
jgi:hypothetical protein